MYICPQVSMCVPGEARKSYRWLRATMWVLKTERSSLKDQQGLLITEPFSPAPQTVLTKTKILNPCVCVCVCV